MKIYFPETGTPFVADYAFAEDEPNVLSFVLKKSQSLLSLRYEVVDSKLVDKYPKLDDEAICNLMQEEAKAEAESLAAKHAAEQAEVKAATP